MAEENGSQDQSPAQLFTSADRIRQLNDIDKDVAKLIHSAGLAIQALTNAKSPNPNTNLPPTASSADLNNSSNTLDSHKTRFKEATSQYFALLSSIDVRLRRQVYALEEASILAPDTVAGTRGGEGSFSGSAGGAQGTLDVSWLNSRKDTVGKEKEAELWRAAREFVEGLDGDGEGKKEVKEEGMEVD